MTELCVPRLIRRRRHGFAAAVRRVLRANRHGRLTLTLPDGEMLTFGEGTNPRGSRDGLDAHIEVKNDAFFRRCVLFGDIGFAESYMAGEWDSDDLAEVVAWFILNERRRRGPNIFGWLNRVAHRLHSNTRNGSRENIAAHYDLSNEFFQQFLDASMTYSSALFESGDETLPAAQTAKYQRVCHLLDLKEGDHVLEIGGGWGAFSRYAAKNYGCRITSITISKQQFDWASRQLELEHLRGHVDLRLADYRDIKGRFDKIVSIEMLEAVGHDYYDTFFAKCAEVLAPTGLVALQVITCPDWRCEPMRRNVDFIQKHIFPGGEVPSVGCLLESVRRTTDFSLTDFFDFGPSYARTLQLWSDAFEAKLPAIRAMGFDETFIRKWRYYFQYCKAGFRMRHISVAQFLLSRSNNHALRSSL
jgi:cyclopropane-fatty-acyl-phospholipid synthase